MLREFQNFNVQPAQIKQRVRAVGSVTPLSKTILLIIFSDRN